MTIEFVIPGIILLFLSWLVFILVHKNITHVTNSHIRILGIENKNLIKSSSFFAVRVLYFVFLLIINAAFLYFLFQY